MAGRLLPCSTTGKGGGRPQGLASREEQTLVESGDLELRAAEELCLLKIWRRWGLLSRSWLRSGDKWARESRLPPREALSGLRESLRELRRCPSSGGSGLKAGWEPLRPAAGKQLSSKAVACLCKRCNLGALSGLMPALESLLFTRPHWVVESRLPFGAVGLVAGGVTELVMIVGGGRAWQDESTWLWEEYE